jgi:hypothetical protein
MRFSVFLRQMGNDAPSAAAGPPANDARLIACDDPRSEASSRRDPTRAGSRAGEQGEGEVPSALEGVPAAVDLVLTVRRLDV